MKNQDNEHPNDKYFVAGDWVSLKLQLYVHQSMDFSSTLSLLPSIMTLIKLVGVMAYRLKRMDISRIHPVFCFSLFMKETGIYKVEKEFPIVLGIDLWGNWELNSILPTKLWLNKGKWWNDYLYYGNIVMWNKLYGKTNLLCVVNFHHWGLKTSLLL